MSSTVVASVIVSFAAYYFNGRIERLKSELSSLRTFQQTRYSWLYEERAKVMREIYLSILEAEDAFDNFLRSYGSLPGQAGPLRRCEAALKAGRRFFDLYRKERLLFSDEIAEKLDDLNRWFVATANAYQRHYFVEKEEYAAFAKFSLEDVKPLPNYKKDLEREFRRLYGTLDAEPA